MHTGILDVAHWELDSIGAHGIDNALRLAREAGITAVFAKATQGKDYIDPSWKVFAPAIRNAGLLLGAYHFASNTAPGDQEADWFLKAVGTVVDVATVRLCLDFEPNPKPSATMTLSQARAWIQRTQGVTERLPTIYGDSSFMGQVHDPADKLGGYPLWIAAYGNPPPRIPKAWAAWTFWQYTDGPNGPRDQVAWPRVTPGFGAKVDRSAFNGTAEQLAAMWLT